MATGVFCCGAECGQLGTVGQHWSTSGTTSISTTTTRTGARAFRVNPSASTAYFDTLNLTSANVWVLRAYVRFATLPDATCPILQTFMDNSGAWFQSSDSKIYPGYASGGTTLGSTGASVTTGVWYRIDVRINASANPWLIDVQVDGTALTQLSRAVAAHAGVQRFELSGNAATITADMFYDDVIASNTSGDYPLGAGSVYQLFPGSDGSHNVAGANDFERGTLGTDIINTTTDAYLLVDDVPLDDTTADTNDYINMIAPPNATDYVAVVMSQDPSGFFASASGNTVNGVEVLAGIHQAGTGLGNMRLAIFDGVTSNDFYSATGVAGTTTLTYKRKFYTVDPTGNAWDVTDVDATVIRFGSPASVDANPDQYFDCAIFEIDVVPAAPGVDQEPSLIGGKLVRNSLLRRHLVH